MSTRRSPRWSLLALAALASGCTSFQPISPRVGLAQPVLEARFPAPTRLVARTRRGTEVVLRDVTRVAGRPLGLRGDTLVLEITSWQGIGHLSRHTGQAIAALPASDPRVVFGTRRLSRRRTGALVLSPFVTAYLLFFYACGLNRCWN